MSAFLVLGGCGHWWHESAPDGLVLTSPRVCTHTHMPQYTGVVGTSPQGLDLVDVVYVTTQPQPPADIRWPPYCERRGDIRPADARGWLGVLDRNPITP